MKKYIKYTILLIIVGLFGFYVWPENKLDTSRKIDKILIIKHERKLIVYSNGDELKTYKISLGKRPVGKKEFEGDKKTPEGLYFINDKSSNSDFHLNLGISYPNEADKKNAEKLNKNPGGQIHHIQASGLLPRHQRGKVLSVALPDRRGVMGVVPAFRPVGRRGLSRFCPSKF